MTPGVNKLDEVVVVGYGTTKRRDLTGAIVSVKRDEITAQARPKSNGIATGKSSRVGHYPYIRAARAPDLIYNYVVRDRSRPAAIRCS